MPGTSEPAVSCSSTTPISTSCPRPVRAVFTCCCCWRCCCCCCCVVVVVVPVVPVVVDATVVRREFLDHHQKLAFADEMSLCDLWKNCGRLRGVRGTLAGLAPVDRWWRVLRRTLRDGRHAHMSPTASSRSLICWRSSRQLSVFWSFPFFLFFWPLGAFHIVFFKKKSGGGGG